MKALFTCTDPKGTKDDDRVKTKIKLMLQDHFVSLGVGGEWHFDLWKKTGGGLNEIRFLKHSKEKPEHLFYFVRPYSRDSSWQIRIFSKSPEFYKIVAEKEGGDIIKDENPVQEQTQVQLVVGQLCRGVISAHTGHGFNVKIDDKWNGFVPLSDISPTFDKKDLLRYPVGKGLRLSVSEIKNMVVTCSTRTDGIAETNNSQDLFSGKSAKSGKLELTGFTKSIERKLQILSYVADVAIKYHPNRAPYDEVFEWVKEMIISQYQTTDVDNRGIGAILLKLCDDGQGTVDPYMRKVSLPNSVEVYITDFGWNELKAINKIYHPAVPTILPVEEAFVPPAPVAPAPVVVVDAVTTGHEDTTTAHDDTPEEPPTPPAPEEPAPAPSTSIEIDDELIKDTIASLDNATVEDISEYMAKAARSAELLNQKMALEKEADEINAWLAKKQHLRVASQRLWKFLQER